MSETKAKVMARDSRRPGRVKIYTQAEIQDYKRSMKKAPAATHRINPDLVGNGAPCCKRFDCSELAELGCLEYPARALPTWCTAGWSPLDPMRLSLKFTGAF